MGIPTLRKRWAGLFGADAAAQDQKAGTSRVCHRDPRVRASAPRQARPLDHAAARWARSVALRERALLDHLPGPAAGTEGIPRTFSSRPASVGPLQFGRMELAGRAARQSP